MKDIGAERHPQTVTSSSQQPPSGVLRLLVSDTGRVDGIDALGAAVGVPQLGAALIAGYHADDIESVSAHLGALVARTGAVAHWDARVQHRGEWVWVHEYGVGRGHGAVDVIRVFPGRDPAKEARTGASVALQQAAAVALHVAISIEGDLREPLPASVVEAVLATWAGVLDEWVRRADGGYLVLMQHCGVAQAQAVARELENSLHDALGEEACGLRVIAREPDCPGGAACTCLALAPVAVVPVALAPEASAHNNARGEIERPAPAILHDYMAGLLPALAEHRLLLHIQPIARIGAALGEPVVAAEFLLRVRNRDGHIERPGLRLLETERAGGMHQVDRWVISRAFALLAEQRAVLERLEFVTVNLSGPSLGQPDLLAHVLRQFLDTGLPPSKVCFEITETAAIPDIPQACMLIEALQRRGCRFAIDDFGAGLASFHLLRVLPVDLLKLDGRLFREPIRQMALLHQLQHLGHSLGKRTVAEHIETAAVCAAVREIGVDYAQGHLFGEPVPPEAFFARFQSAG